MNRCHVNCVLWNVKNRCADDGRAVTFHMTPRTLHAIAAAFFFLLYCAGTAVAEEMSPLTLDECVTLALKRSETIAIQQEIIKQTEGRFLQALSGVLPRAAFEASEKRQDANGGSAFTLREVPERKFVLTQPLFSGFKEFAAMAGSRAERRERALEKTRAEQLLFVDVSDAFYLLREQREDVAALERLRAALMGRIDELEERRRLGRSRQSEVVSVEAQLRRIEAEMERVRNQETAARQLLEFLTGLPRVDGIIDPEPGLPPLATEETYLARVNARPDVRAAEEAWRVSKAGIGVARAAFWPTLDLENNYYAKRAGTAKDIDWDVLLTLDVPLFQGGKALGAAREASSLARQAKLRSEETTRKATLEIRNAYATIRGAIDRHLALQRALTAAEENYRLELEDYRLSLVNTLEVLQALEALQDARRDVIHTMYDAKRRYGQLLAATGETR